MHILSARFKSNLGITKIMKLLWNLKMNPFLLRNQGIIIEIFFSDTFSVDYIFSYVHFLRHFIFLKHFTTFSCFEYYVAAWIFVVKDMNVQEQHT